MFFHPGIGNGKGWVDVSTGASTANENSICCFSFDTFSFMLYVIDFLFWYPRKQPRPLPGGHHG